MKIKVDLYAQGVVVVLLCLFCINAVWAAPRLRVSDNQRYLVTEDGTPFFYLGDTAWELFHWLDRQEADRYLEDRAAKGFTVIQADWLDFNTVKEGP